ncbi:MAG TPA: efflux RND transporter periplasmic adaptor subunit, partial [Candidatus Binataceae bacterium]|nr:efflux RND transporter periplasmic adaptor subunit [Candidatus Binataceae bacterium]
LISTQQFDKSSSDLRVAEADAQASAKQAGLAQKKLDDTYIRAPFDGAIQMRRASLGEHVAEGTPLLELIATDPIKLRAPLPERFAPLAKVGLKVELSVDAEPGKNYEGKVTRIAPALDETSRTLLIEAEVPNPDGALKPGYFAHVTIDLGRDAALFVPQSAVLRYAGIARVFVFKDGAVQAREVVTGESNGSQIEILNGVSAGDEVVTTDVDRLADGVQVSAKE